MVDFSFPVFACRLFVSQTLFVNGCGFCQSFSSPPLSLEYGRRSRASASASARRQTPDTRRSHLIGLGGGALSASSPFSSITGADSACSLSYSEAVTQDVHWATSCHGPITKRVEEQHFLFADASCCQCDVGAPVRTAAAEQPNLTVTVKCQEGCL